MPRPIDIVAKPACRRAAWAAFATAALAISSATPCSAGTPYDERAPAERYRMASADEIALARSAAPVSVSRGATVLVLGEHGYDTAVKGDNGFVCLVQRSWAKNFDDTEFWSARMRAPLCVNAAAAASVLPAYLERTRWVLAGVSRAEMETRVRAEVTAGRIGPPKVGAMSFMMAKGGWLNDQAGPWRPHVMLFLPRMAPSAVGANMPGAPLDADASALEPVTVVFIPVARWSDGTSGPTAD